MGAGVRCTKRVGRRDACGCGTWGAELVRRVRWARGTGAEVRAAESRVQRDSRVRGATMSSPGVELQLHGVAHDTPNPRRPRHARHAWCDNVKSYGTRTVLIIKLLRDGNLQTLANQAPPQNHKENAAPTAPLPSPPRPQRHKDLQPCAENRLVTGLHIRGRPSLRRVGTSKTRQGTWRKERRQGQTRLWSTHLQA